eukprot:TRINITY_DN2753_c0_g1_i1.p1 TRINITY_DN2753_c0_g1~~TRINITY_DN2753_c0_g1_i1.p1  ORF type:complete len:2351 (+),score=723.34 TRINITY_DN2753_c0_g1_i1:121-7173(+)
MAAAAGSFRAAAGAALPAGEGRREEGEGFDLMEKQKRVLAEKQRKLEIMQDYHATVRGQAYLRQPLIERMELDISFSATALQKVTEELERHAGSPEDYFDMGYIAKVHRQEHDEIALAVIGMCDEQPVLSRTLYAKIFDDKSTVQSILLNPSTSDALKFQVLLYSAPSVLPDITDIFYLYLQKRLWDHCAACLRTQKVSVTPSILLAVCRTANLRLLSLILRKGGARAVAKGHFLMMFATSAACTVEQRAAPAATQSFAPFELRGVKVFPSTARYPGTCLGVPPPSFDSIHAKHDPCVPLMVVDTAYFAGRATFEVAIDAKYALAEWTRAVVVGWADEGCEDMPGMDELGRSWGFSLEARDGAAPGLHPTKYHCGDAVPAGGAPLAAKPEGDTYVITCTIDFTRGAIEASVDGVPLPQLFLMSRPPAQAHPVVWLEAKAGFLDVPVVSVTDHVEDMLTGSMRRHGASIPAPAARAASQDNTWALDQGVAMLLRHGADSNAAMHVPSPLVHLFAARQHGQHGHPALFPLDDAALPTTPILPLHFCLYMGYEASALAVAGCTNLALDSRDALGNTPLVLAAAKACTPVLHRLVERGANVCLASRSGLTPLRAALITRQPRAAGDVLDALEKLPPAARQEALDYRTKESGTTAVFEAVLAGLTPVAERLVALGADVMLPDGDHNYPLFYAAQHCPEPVLVMMLRAPKLTRGDLNKREASDLKPTLLHFTALGGMLDASAQLLRLGADPNLYTRHGHTPLFSAVTNRHEDVALLLLGPRGNADDKQLAARDEKGNTVLNLAAQHGMARLVQGMYDRLVPASFRRNVDGRTPLYSAIATRNFNIAGHIAHSEHAGLEEEDKRGYTPLCLAAEIGALTVVEVLIECGAHVGHKTREGHSALYLAIQAEDASVAMAIVQNGHARLDLHETKEFGTTLAEYAAFKGMAEVSRLLINLGAPYDKNREEALRKYGTAPVDPELTDMLVRVKSMMSMASIRSGKSKKSPGAASHQHVASPSVCPLDDDAQDEAPLEIAGSDELWYVLSPAGRTLTLPHPPPRRHTPPPSPSSSRTQSHDGSLLSIGRRRGTACTGGSSGSTLQQRRSRQGSHLSSPGKKPRTPNAPSSPGSPGASPQSGGKRLRGRELSRLGATPPPPEVIPSRGALIALASSLGSADSEGWEHCDVAGFPAAVAMCIAAATACAAAHAPLGRVAACDTEDEALAALAFLWTCKLHPIDAPLIAYKALRALAEPQSARGSDSDGPPTRPSTQQTAFLPSLHSMAFSVGMGSPAIAVGSPGAEADDRAAHVAPVTVYESAEGGASWTRVDSVRMSSRGRTATTGGHGMQFDPWDPLPPARAHREAHEVTSAKFEWMCAVVGVQCTPRELLNHIYPTPDRAAGAGALAKYVDLAEEANAWAAASVASRPDAVRSPSSRGKPGSPAVTMPRVGSPVPSHIGSRGARRASRHASLVSAASVDDTQWAAEVDIPEVQLPAAALVTAVDPLQRFLLLVITDQDFHRHLHAHSAQLASGPPDAVVKNTLGMQAVHVAAVLGHLEALDALLSAGADVNAAWVDGLTPSMLCILNEHAAAAQMVLTHPGCDVQARTGLQGHTAFTLALRYNHEVALWMQAEGLPLAVRTRAGGKYPLAHALHGAAEAPKSDLAKKVMDAALPSVAALAHAAVKPQFIHDAMDAGVYRWVDALLRHADATAVRDDRPLLLDVLTGLLRACAADDVDRVAKGVRQCFNHQPTAFVWAWRGPRGETVLHLLCKRHAVRLLDFLSSSMGKEVAAAKDVHGRIALQYLRPGRDVERSAGVLRTLRRSDADLARQWLLTHRRGLGNKAFVALVVRMSEAYPTADFFDKTSDTFAAVVQHFWLAFFALHWFEGSPPAACLQAFEKVHPLVLRMASPVAVIIALHLCATVPISSSIPTQGTPSMLPAPSAPAPPPTVRGPPRGGESFRRRRTEQQGRHAHREAPRPAEQFAQLGQQLLGQVMGVWSHDHEMVGRFMELASRFGHTSTLERIFCNYFALVGDMKSDLRVGILLAAASTCQAPCLLLLLTYDRNTLFTEAVMRKNVLEAVLNGKEMAPGDKWRCVEVLLSCRIPLCAGILAYIEEQTGGLDYRSPLFQDTLLHVAAVNGQTEYIDTLTKSESFTLLAATNVFGLRAMEYATKDCAWLMLREAERQAGFQIRVPDYLISYGELQSRMVKHQSAPDSLVAAFLENNYYYVNSMGESGFTGSLAVAATAAMLQKHAAELGVKFPKSAPPPELQAQLAQYNARHNFLADVELYQPPPGGRQAVVRQHLQSLRSDVFPFEIPLIPHQTFAAKPHLVAKPRHRLGARIEEPPAAPQYDFHCRLDIF